MSVETFPALLIAYLTASDGTPDQVDPSKVVCKEGAGAADSDLLNAGVDSVLILTHQFDAGYVTEERILQQPVFQLRICGPQRDLAGAKALAWAADRRLMRIGSPGYSSVVIGGYRVSRMSHAGSGPTLLLKDSSQRSHFTTSYVTLIPSGL